MLPYILVAFFLLTTVVLALYIYLNVSKQRSVDSTQKYKNAQLQGQVFETKIWDELHSRLGYSIEIKPILDSIVNSFPSIIKYSVASYVLLEGSKVYYKSYLSESVSKAYLENTKNTLLDVLKSANPSVIGTESIEEEITGNLLSYSEGKGSKAMSSFDIALVTNQETIGVLNISSSKSGQYRREDVELITRIVERAMSEITQLEQLLNKEKSKLEVMVENMHDGVVMLDDDFKILTINPRCLRMIGKEPNTSITIFDVVGYFAKEFPLAEMIADVFEKGDSKSVADIQYDNVFYDVYVVPVKSGNTTSAVGIIIHDKTKEHELISLREDFTSMIVHELRAPLTVIMDTADLVNKRYDDLAKEQILSLLVQVQSSSTGLLNIVNDLLDTAKLEAGKLELIMKPGMVNKLLEDEVNYFKHLAGKKGIELAVRLDPAVREMVYDENKLKQVLNNLLSNAIKFTDSGSVIVSSKRLGSSIEISVADTGVGISKEDKVKLFNKFEQIIKPKSTGEGGTGLGLVITKGIIEAHGGEIRLLDNEPHGTNVVFTLPLKK